ncbi:MAG: aminotransferase class V-fold PLP-dependent enzyme [Geminicoccaceae bacterium]|nr:aminotransferase class V-fold PLP-dependent enzyme [Geminicoccaceae bacterium]MDW8371140.1 aminotransferase class V-fold PLP-dependent enzyme [Geminicoccaceae bacterium]
MSRARASELAPPNAAPRLDLAGLKGEFPIFEAQGPRFHYLDNAATGQICRAAAAALVDFETRARANVKRGVYRLADEATQAFEEARARIAAYLGAREAREVVITSGTTHALNIAAHTLCARLRPGDEILLSLAEHHANIVPWQLAAARVGAVIRAIPLDAEARLDLDRLTDLVSRKTKVIAVTHCSNVTGALTDLGRIREAAQAVGALFVVDGAQRAPHGPLDVQAMGCDLYALSGHKLFGATGAGALWIRAELAEELPPFLGGGEMIRRVTIERTSFAPAPHRFEAGTPPIGPALATGAAAAWLAGLDWQAIHAHELALTERLLAGLRAIRGVRPIGPEGLQARAPLVSFVVEGVHPHDVCQLLDMRGVCTRGGHHCAQPLHEALGLEASVRASIALYNEAEDVDALLEGLEDVVRRLA